jgi:hypothetical protein
MASTPPTVRFEQKAFRGEADHADPHAGGLLALTVRDLLAALNNLPRDAELLAFEADWCS